MKRNAKSEYENEGPRVTSGDGSSRVINGDVPYHVSCEFNASAQPPGTGHHHVTRAMQAPVGSNATSRGDGGETFPTNFSKMKASLNTVDPMPLSTAREYKEMASSTAGGDRGASSTLRCSCLALEKYALGVRYPPALRLAAM